MFCMNLISQSVQDIFPRKIDTKAKIGGFQTKPLAFCGQSLFERTPACDLFQKNIQDNENRSKHVQIKTIEGKTTDVTIARTLTEENRVMGGKNNSPVQFKMNKCTNSGTHYYAIAHGKKGEEFYLDELYCDETYLRKYKGAGTELLKCVVEEAKERGCTSVFTGASNFPPPFVFYYKNNFQVVSNQSKYNAAIDYAAKKNIPITDLIEKSQSSLPMELTLKEAEAFLKGERTFQERSLETVMTREIKGHLCEANLIETPSEENHPYYLQIIDTARDELMQRFCARVRIKEDEKNEKYLEIFDVDDNYANDEILKLAADSAQVVAEKFGITKVEFNFERLRKRK